MASRFRTDRRRASRGSARAWLLGALGVATALALWIAPQLYWGQALQPADHAYAPGPRGACARLDAPAPTPIPPMRVRTPRNYDPQVPHPLLVVFSPAGFGPGLTERFMGLTHEATARGLIVAYVGSAPLRRDLPARLSTIPARLAATWCLDAARITLAGHSDGGTLAQVIALQRPRSAPRAVVASGAGLQAGDFATLTCPGPTDVLILHGRQDTHFPGFGVSAATAWAGCLHCDPDPGPEDAAGCQTFNHCAGSLRLCLHGGGHLTLPREPLHVMLDQAASEVSPGIVQGAPGGCITPAVPEGKTT